MFKISRKKINVDLLLRKCIDTNKRNKKLEKHLLKTKDVDTIFKYIVYVMKGRWIKAEPIILRSRWNIDYASIIVRGRWHTLESLIIKEMNVYDALYYSIEIMKSRWKEVEHIILTNDECIVRYCINVRRRWSKGEELLSPPWKSVYREMIIAGEIDEEYLSDDDIMYDVPL